MMTIDEYIRPRSVEEAYARLIASPNGAIVGGGVFMHLASRKIGVALDLSSAGLSFIRETDQAIEIGAMTTLRELEQSVLLQKNLAGLLPNTVSNIAGIQLRNLATVGGTVYGRYGFSELLTSLLVLDTQVVLHRTGRVSLPEFLKLGKLQDVLEKIVITKQPLQGSYQVVRISAGSLPILCVAVSKAETAYKIAVGARPGVATLAVQAMDCLGSSSERSASVIEEAAGIAARELNLGSDRKATTDYRKELCRVLVKRAVMEVTQ